MRPIHLLALCFLSAVLLPGQAVITTLAGTQFAPCGYSGDNGPATQAQMCNPQMAITDSVGNIYFSDAANGAIRKITPAGIITTIAGNGQRGTTGDGGPAINAELGSVYQLAFDGTNNICFGDFLAYKIRCISLSTGIIQGYGTGSPMTAGDGGQFSNASYYMPTGAVFVLRSLGNSVFSDLYISDLSSNVVRKVDGATGIITTIAGTGLSGPLGDGGPATSATLSFPWSLAYFNGSLYIADSGNDRVRAVNLSTGIITTVAGNGSPYFAGDGGPATSAALSPRQITFDAIGQMYIADTGRIRKIDLSGTITTYAGNGNSGIGPDNVPPSQTYFAGLEGVYWNAPANQLIISDGANKIRQVVYQGTTTDIAANPQSVPPGGQVTLTATVSAAAATGTVNFMINGVLAGSAPVSGGQAVFTFSPTNTSNTAGAIYLGDATYAPSLSGIAGVSVQKTTTTTTIASNPNPSNLNQTVTLTSTVTPSTATGTIQFYAGGVLLASQILDRGTATLTNSFANAGPVTIYAVYSGDAGNSGSTSPNLIQTVLNPTALAISSGQNPSAVGTAVTLIASVTPSTATGTVQFLEGLVTLGSATISGGSASFSVTLQTQGTHEINAVYSGDANNASSTSSLLPQLVKAVSGLAVSSSLNPAVVGQSVTFTATLNSSATGTVQFLDGNTVLGTIPVTSGVAAFSSASLTQGTHPISVVYSGDGTFLSSSAAPFTETVNPKATTTTTVTSTPNPSNSGASVAFTATVTPSTATGTVQFLDGGALLGTGTISGGSASFTTASLAQGTHSITAVYSGDATDAASTSSALQQTVNKVSTTTSLNGSAAVSTLGTAVTFTATVSPAGATGTVQFSAFATNSGSSYSLGSAPVVSGAATLTTTALVSGPNAVTAIYSGDSQNASSTSAAFNEMVRFASGTGLTSSLNPSTSGASVTLTATVFPPNSGQTGSVQFFNGSVLLGTSALSAGLTAQLITTALPVGTDSLTAVYSGDTVWAGSTSTALSQTVNKVGTTTTLISSPNPSTSGASVTLTATVSPSTATGTVQFLDGATVLGTSTLASGSATFSTTSLTQGTHSITAVYSGDANNAPSTSAAASQVVKGTTSVVLTSSLNPAVVGQSIVFTATVNSAATGTVQFLDGSTVIGTGTVSSGVATFATTSLAQGTHSISATYSGDTNYASASSAPLTETVNAKTATTTALAPLAGSPNPSNPGALVGFTATVSPSTATGTVQFLDGTTVLATLPISGGSVSFNFQLSTAGQHLITAAYSGDSSDLGSTSAAFTQTVRNATTVSLSSTPNPSLVGGPVTFVAVVSPSTATGTVQFQDGATALGAANISGGMATFSSAILAQGTHTITAVYGGDSNDAVATSNAVSQVVNAKTTTTTTVSSSVNPSTVGQSVKFTASVSPTSATGTVQFLDGTTVIGTAALASGGASFTTTTLTQGAHSITASYSGDAADNASISSALTQTVNVAAPAAPSNLTATDAGSSQINLAWTASATSGVTYDVYRSTTSGFTPSASNRIASGVTTTSYSATGLSGSTTYYFRASAVNAGGESADSNQASATTTATLSCHVSYSVTTQWPGGFGGAFSIKNTGTTPINGWTLTWTWPGNQAVTQSWDANYSQHGANVSFTNESFDATIAPGKTLSGMGFNATWSGSNVAPTAFYLNGSLCQ